MICPRCRGDFRPELYSCPDCGVDLVQRVETPTDRSVPDPGSSTVVLRTADPSALALARSLLEEAGIPFAVNNERMIGLFPSALAAPTLDSKYRAAEIEVLESNLESAREVLAEIL